MVTAMATLRIIGTEMRLVQPSIATESIHDRHDPDPAHCDPPDFLPRRSPTTHSSGRARARLLTFADYTPCQGRACCDRPVMTHREAILPVSDQPCYAFRVDRAARSVWREYLHVGPGYCHWVGSVSDVRVRELLRVALDEFDLPSTTLSASARRAVRIAALRRDYVNQLWLQWELTDLQASMTQKLQEPAISMINDQIEALLGADEGRRESHRAVLQFERNRTFLVDGAAKVFGQSVGQIEQELAMVRRTYDEMTVPANLTPIDTYFVSKTMDSSKATLLPTIQRLEQMLERVKSAVYSFLVTTESQLDDGQRESSLFLRAQDYINSSMAKYAPDALGKFVAAQDRLNSGNPEDLAHALTSCRRMIKSLADALYPATDEKITGEDGAERVMSDEFYRNRLLQYVREQLGRHKQGPVIQKTLDGLGARLNSLDSLASKGVHDEVSAAEAETCIVWTYLLAADIVRIADGSSALLVAENAEPARPSA